MTTALEPMDKDFEQMMQMLSGFWVTQIAGAVPSYSITDHLAKRSATAQQISAIAGTDKAKIPGRFIMTCFPSSSVGRSKNFTKFDPI
jgi:hypothetical protein